MWCSTGWCVGPSSPSATESCVKTHADVQAHERRQADRAAHVVGELQERRAVRPHDAAVGGHAVDRAAHAVLAHAEEDVAARAPPSCTCPTPGSSVFVDSDRSAAPPTIVGTTGSNAAMTLPPALRVATFVPTSNAGSTSATGDDGRPAQAASHSVARARRRRAHRSKRSLPLGLQALAALGRERLVDAVGHEELRVGIPAERLLGGARTLSSPSALPCTSLVPCWATGSR